MPPPSLRDFLETSLTALARAAPESYARVCATLAGRRISVEGDDRPFAVHFSSTAARFVDEVDGNQHVSTRMERATVLALLDGNLRVEDALRRDLLVVRGSVGDTADVFDALTIYVRGAIRCPSSPTLLSRFRASVTP